MQYAKHLREISAWLLLSGCLEIAAGQTAATHVALSVTDENGAAVPGATVVIQEPGRADLRLATDYAGHSAYDPQGGQQYRLRVEKPGFYETVVNDADPLLREIHVVLNHEQMVLQQVSVTATPPGIDPEQISDTMTMNLPEIISIPYPTSRDIRNLLPFYPGVVQDHAGQIHVAGSETWATLDTLDGFDIRSPVSGALEMRVSTDAVRSIDQAATRYPVEYGRATGGVIAYSTGMGDNKFRFNATDFIPSLEDVNGIRFDKFVPRITFSGPIKRNRAWFFDGLEAEYDDIYIKELPQGADTNHLIRGSNLIKAQANLSPANILSGGLLWNGLHSPYDGISSLVPQESSVNRDTIAWLPYVRDQIYLKGALLDMGLGVVRFSNSLEPHGDSPFELTPELEMGSFFENLDSHSQRVEGNAALYLPTKHLAGTHNLKVGIDLDHISFDETVTRMPVNYLREDRTLLRRSDFPVTPPFTRHNVEIGAYAQDRWSPMAGLLFEPGVRFDWDEIIRRPLFSPRLAMTYSPEAAKTTKISAGIGLYYEHTQLEYLTRALAGIRYDTYFAADGVTPTSPALETNFIADYGTLHEARALNWSVGLEQRLPWAIYLKASVIRKNVSNEFVYANQSGPATLSGEYALTNTREDHDNLAEVEARRTFANGYTLFAAYTHSSAHTNAAIDYVPTISMLGPQQSGPLGWDSPNRVLSWGWLPFPLFDFMPSARKRWDFVCSADWHTGFPYTSIDANHEVVGAPGSRRFPNYLSLSPGLEWRFHFRGMYLGLRGSIENATGSGNYLQVNNNVDSPQYGTFSEPVGRAFTARIRLISTNNK